MGTMPEHYDVIIIDRSRRRDARAPRRRGRRSPAQRGIPPTRASGVVRCSSRTLCRRTWYDPDGRPFQPQVHYSGRSHEAYGAALHRPRPHDFGSSSMPTASPRGRLGDDFEPWYSRPNSCTRCTASRRWIHRGTLSQYRGRPSPHEPHPTASDDLTTPASPVPRPVRTRARRNPSSDESCIRCTWCDGYPCPVHASLPALASPNVTLLVNAEARDHPSGAR
jgi:hypothetical protein